MFSFKDFSLLTSLHHLCLSVTKWKKYAFVLYVMDIFFLTIYILIWYMKKKEAFQKHHTITKNTEKR